jgi:hypothetical protein
MRYLHVPDYHLDIGLHCNTERASRADSGVVVR